MSVKKCFLIVLLTFVLSMAIIGNSAVADVLNTRVTELSLGSEIDISSLNLEERAPSVAYNWKHHEYLVVWQTNWTFSPRDIRGARVSATGQIIEDFIVYESFSVDSAQPDVAYDPVNDRYLVVFIYDSLGNGSNMDVYGRFIPWDGPSSSLNEFVICYWNNHQWNPKVTYARKMQEFLVAWNNEDQSHALKANIAISRVKASDGSLLGDMTLYDNTNVDDKTHVDVAYNLARNEYLVVYDNTYDIFATRFTGDLKEDFGGEFAIATWPATESYPAVAACVMADQYLVTWTSNQSDQGTPNDAIYGRFIYGYGDPGSVHEIADVTTNDRYSDVTCNNAGTQYLVAWQLVYTNLFWGIWGRLINPQGTLEPGFEIVSPYSNKERMNVALAGGHFDYLAVWEHERAGYLDIHGRLINTGPRIFLPLILR